MKEIIKIGLGQFGVNLVESSFDDLVQDHGIDSQGY